jgi:hypothetical protein
MKHIKDLKMGDPFYDADRFSFTWYEYLMPMPVKNIKNEGYYHIVINKKKEEPERIYKDELAKILEKNLNSLEDVRKYQIKKTEDWLKYLKEEV